MTYQEAIELLSSEVGEPFDFPTQKIAGDLLIAARAQLIRQEAKQTGVYPTFSVMQVCLPTTTMSSTACCGVDLGCSLPVTEPLPLPIDNKSTMKFLFVGSIDMLNEVAYGYIKPSEIASIKHRKFSANLPYYTIIDYRVIVFNKPALAKIKLRYVPANPLDLKALKNCDGNACFDEASSVFIEEWWFNPIASIVVPQLRGILNKQIPVNEEERKPIQ